MKPKLTKAAKAGQPRPKVSDFIWWHKCATSGRREYRAQGWNCAQCGAECPDGDYIESNIAFAQQVLFLALTRSRR